jgi:alkylhydroperoxidase family enzyme
MEDQLIIRLSDRLHKTAGVDDLLRADLSAHLTEEQLVELIILAGLYHAVSFMVNATGGQHEPFAPRFPSHA